MLINCLSVGIGGFLGSVLRYLLSLVPFLNKGTIPYQTLLANVLGAFLIGIIVGFSSWNPSVSEPVILMLKVGVCGGFTTFSTFSNESLSLLENGKYSAAFTYVLLSLILCVTGVFLGKQLITFCGK